MGFSELTKIKKINIDNGKLRNQRLKELRREHLI